MDLIKQYQPKSVLDPMMGSGTTRDVCRQSGIPCDSFDLHYGFNALTDSLPAKKYDMIFLHPPYHSMIKYSEDPRDLSNSPTLQDFLQKLSAIVTRLSEYLSEDGHIVILIGNMRKKGRYYPLGAYMETIFHAELKEELVKLQHNTNSSRKEYPYDNSNFIPIAHEKVLVFAGFKPITWAELVIRAVEELGGTATVQEVYGKLQSHPKILQNPTFKATIRRTLQESAKQLNLGVWTIEEGESNKSSSL